MSPVMLVIMDGLGINPTTEANAVALANKPFLGSLWERWPTTAIKTCGEDVGLPEGVMGNSEVGHTNIGAGRVVFQSLARINKDIRDGHFHQNPRIKATLDRTIGRNLHLMGLLSTGGVHAEVSHVEAILECCRINGVKDVYLHLFTDGRDMPPRSALDLVRRIEEAMAKTGVGRIATISGRYYAMDRDKRWERTKKAYDAIVRLEGPVAASAAEVLERSYGENITDEFVVPTVIEKNGSRPPQFAADDTVFFWNFRPDRARQMTRALTDPGFDGFDRGVWHKVSYLCMVRYDEQFALPIAYPEDDLKNTLAEVIANADKTQFHTAETEKYAHVTFFLNGRREEPFQGEERKLIPSPKVATYDLQPEMSASGVTEAVLEAIDRNFDFIIVNYANPDMVGHTGVLDAARKAVEAVDDGLAKIVPAWLARGGVALVTADHGNAEQMIWYETGEPHTQHTTFDVTFTVCGVPPETKLRAGGRLADIAPTVLDLMKIPQPPEMTGESLIR